jgi:hypothetical protein
MKYSYWYGTNTSEKERIFQHGLTLDSKLVTRSDGDLYARGGFQAFRRIGKAIVAANEKAQNNSLPMLVRIIMDDSGLVQTGPEISTLYFPKRDEDSLLDAFAQVVYLLRNAPIIPTMNSLTDKLPHYDSFKQSIIYAYGLSGSDAVEVHEKFIVDAYLSSLMFSVVRLLDWEHQARNRLNIINPEANWTLQTQLKRYMFSFPAPVAAKIKSPVVLLEELGRNLAYFNRNFGTDIRTFPAYVGEPKGNQKSRVDFVFRLDAVTQNFKAATATSPAMYVDKYFNTILFGSVDGDFVKQWTTEVGPYENISWETDQWVA